MCFQFSFGDAWKFLASVKYREMRLFQLAGLFRSYTNFITVIAQRTKIIELNYLYLYEIQTDHI